MLHHAGETPVKAEPLRSPDPLECEDAIGSKESPAMHARLGATCSALALFLGACVCREAATGRRTASSAVDPGAKYVIYLHGRILQERQERRPRNSRFGTYEYDQILSAFRERGFLVTSELRPADTGVEDYSKKVARDVQRLVNAGVPARRITVVGASMGGVIALAAAGRMHQANVNLAILASCSPGTLAYLRHRGLGLSGHVLSFRESSDELAGSCRGLVDLPASEKLSLDDEIVLHTGLGHGFLYRPMPEWMAPLVAWASERAAP
jgi:pimeloyl-ACP methyl ester carboxylesterase